MASEYLKWKYKDVKPDEKPVYTKKELRRNWWDYNLIWVIVGIVGALILFFIIKDMFFRTKPDYEVALIAANAPEEETQDALKARIAELGEDLNGDGKVAVELYIYDVDFSDPDEDYSDMERREAVMTRLTVDLTSGDVFLILVDQPEAFQARFGILSYLDGTAPDAEELGQSATVIATGGIASSVCPLCRREILVNDDLLLTGLAAIFEKNRKK